LKGISTGGGGGKSKRKTKNTGGPVAGMKIGVGDRESNLEITGGTNKSQRGLEKCEEKNVQDGKGGEYWKGGWKCKGTRV